MRGGFTLLEVAVAAVVLQIGLLGVLGLLLTARRTALEARRLEEATAEVQWVVDSLASLRPSGRGGRRDAPWGVLEWSTAQDGSFEVMGRSVGGGVLLRVHGRAGSGAP